MSAFYSDKHSIFKTTREQCVDRRLQHTQLHRALNSLQIELICAHSSQAKGRVERANKTLQDRLVKEMRLRGIDCIEAANAYAPEFLLAHNKKFCVPPKQAEDAHRPLHHSLETIKRILSLHTERTLTKNLEFSLDGRIYQITTLGTGYRLRHQKVTIFTHADGSQEILADKQPLAFKILPKLIQKPWIADTKDLSPLMDQLVAAEQTRHRQLGISRS